ncbi:MAG TPA: HepT-like ribonuclease domain-containing protein [Ramlibacter sp.]|uniref:HepT-like ribonuclease domain-containing protein n=1 Tax=Ramlibacter sp. TaxID=1917967 RepID=UPI002BB673A7|nr:HepT-like ribonuclease domain-containing protein [Ramlibacter sp.]HVZ45918.1 HepT-like ribonuclease domain-containing protein [Ramlibacter sp.]
MIGAAHDAIGFLTGRRREDLDADRMLLFAVVRAIEIFGEAASRISEDTRVAGSAIPWKAIIGMRNRLIHAYFDINAQLVWESVTVEIPAILPLLQQLAAPPGADSTFRNGTGDS